MMSTRKERKQTNERTNQNGERPLDSVHIVLVSAADGYPSALVWPPIDDSM